MLQISLASVATVLLVLTLVSGLGVAAVVALLLHQPAETDELPQMLNETLEEPVEPDNHRGVHRRSGQRQHRYPLHEPERPSPGPTMYGRPLSPIARALRHPAVQLSVVTDPAGEITWELVRTPDGGSVLVPRGERTAVLPVVEVQ